MSRSQNFLDSQDKTLHLSDTDRRIIDFVKSQKKPIADSSGEIMSKFGMTTTSFAQRLVHLIDNPEAAKYDPHTISTLKAVGKKS